ncbi:hypothetical protein DF3PA_30028 [Candidatus Defluviicoccus seviourii]|uniref:Uncharacterized protein n=2 Tax=root TaxID=1 RepID=A0A564WEA3_9PROT|nr:hypothetical protein DF3PB_210009 [uncultured Defluviicoccus sp.]VUX46800.1 hypothetical protein DF3PA_30028 [Candidatus Defluviicoccus seviourii]
MAGRAHSLCRPGVRPLPCWGARCRRRGAAATAVRHLNGAENASRADAPKSVSEGGARVLKALEIAVALGHDPRTR